MLGTEERNSSNKLKRKFTVYIVEIQIGEKIKEKIFIRFKEIVEVDKFVKKNI